MYQANQQIVHINLDDILPNRFQPRLKFNEEEIANLAESIKEHGVIQPIVVRKLGDRYELIAGERRTKASIMAGKTTIPAIVVDLNDSESAEVALIENVQRQDLTSIEEAVSYRKILDMGYLNQSQLADKVGKKQSTIANKLRLLTLPKKVQDALLDSQISERHARSLLRLDNVEKQNKMLDRIIEERLTVRKTDQEIDKMINNSKIEVLDINNLPRKGEEEMNNNYDMNGMGIPTNNVVPEFSTPTSPNPGFMDIERIQNQAQDINVSAPMPSVPEQTMSTISVEQKSDEIPVPKFFNLLDPQPINNSTSEPSIESPSVAESVTALEPKEQNENFNIFDVPNTQINLEPQQTMDIPNVSVENTIAPEIQPVADFSTPIDLYQAPIEPEMPTPVAHQPELNSTFEAFNPIESQSVEVPLPTIEPVSINESNDEIAIIDENIFNEETASPIPTLEPQPVSLPIKDAIVKVRECSNVLNQMGYVVDTDEIDLDDKYQVIFNIQK